MNLRMPQNINHGNPDNFRKMILLSLIFHIVALIIIFISIPSSSRRVTFGPVYSVQLVGSEAAITRESKRLSDFTEEKVEPRPTTIKRKPEGLAPEPIKKEEPEKLDVLKALEALKQKEIASRTEDTAVTDSEDGISATGGPASPGQTSDQRNEYYATIWSKVKGNWALPQALMPADNVEAIIAVKISRGGTVENIYFEKRSGNRYFDDSALNAVKKSLPFPPLPSYIAGSYIEIGIRFHSTELR
ncbi:MAG TPA: TonB family protein [Deltaproteobacteria bacterium]|nr:TonB family protein [Deltaproteobacteria bacterium]